MAVDIKDIQNEGKASHRGKILKAFTLSLGLLSVIFIIVVNLMAYELKA